jgi:serine phosphatase RsbU (regulator of sigma subunit)
LAEATVHICPGDTLLFYTDGITEARDPGGEMFNEERLIVALEKCDQRPGGLIDYLGSLLTAHRGTSAQLDDQTLVALTGT